jgi:hypothetical protein
VPISQPAHANHSSRNAIKFSADANANANRPNQKRSTFQHPASAFIFYE